MKRACPSCHRPIDEEAAYCPACGVDVRRSAPRRPAAAGRRPGRPRLLPVAAAGFLVLLSVGLLGRFLEPEGEPVLDCASLLSEARSAAAAGRSADGLSLVAPAGSARCGSEGRRLAAELLHELSLAHEHPGTVAARARRARERSLSDDPLDPAGLRGRAELASRHEDPVTAAAWWEAAVDAERDRPLASLERAQLLNDAAVAALLAGRPGRARLHLERASAEPQAPASVVANLSLLALREGRLAGAAAGLGLMLAAEPGRPPVQAALAEIDRLQGRSGMARSRAESALAVDPDCLPALHVLALLHLEQGEGEEAARLLRRALELAPGEGRLLADLERARR